MQQNQYINSGAHFILKTKEKSGHMSEMDTSVCQDTCALLHVFLYL